MQYLHRSVIGIFSLSVARLRNHFCAEILAAVEPQLSARPTITGRARVFNGAG
jgi:hypothetical protein